MVVACGQTINVLRIWSINAQRFMFQSCFYAAIQGSLQDPSFFQSLIVYTDNTEQPISIGEDLDTAVSFAFLSSY